MVSDIMVECKDDDWCTYLQIGEYYKVVKLPKSGEKIITVLNDIGAESVYSISRFNITDVEKRNFKLGKIL